MEERLHKFVCLVDNGGFTKAATAMHISQPALTSAVKKLERELHAELLVRGSRILKLTPAGRAAYEAAKQIRTQIHNLETNILEETNKHTDLRLGMIDSIADLLFVHTNNLEPLESQANLSLVIDNTGRLVNYVEHSSLDIALTTKTAFLTHGLTSAIVGLEPLILATSPKQAKSVRQGLHKKELSSFLGYNQGSHTYRIVSEQFEQMGIEIRYSFYSTSPEIMLQIVLAGRGVAVLPYILAKQYIEQEKLVACGIKSVIEIPRTIVAIYQKDHRLPKIVSKLLDKTHLELANLMSEANSLQI